MLNLSAIISFVVVLIGILASLILFSRKAKSPYTRNLLIAIVLALSYTNLIHGLLNSGIMLEVPHFFRTGSPVEYIIAPLIFLYTKAKLRDEKKFNRVQLLHFIPSVLQFLVLIPFYLQPAQYKIDILIPVFDKLTVSSITQIEPIPPAYNIMLRKAFSIVYLIMALLYIRVYWKNKEKSTITNKGQLQWLIWLSATLVISNTLIIVFIASGMPSWFIFKTIFIGSALTFLIILLILFFQPEILYDLTPEVKDEETSNQTESPLKERQVQLTKEETKKYLHILDNYLEENKPYLNPEYRLQQMVNDTKIPRHHLSALINSCYGLNFNQFVNHHRVTYVTKNFNNPDWKQLSLEGIGQQAGFKSRSTFLKSFKTVTGKTPSEFKKSQSA